MASFLFCLFPLHLRLLFSLRPVLQRPQQEPEQCVLIQQVFRSVCQLLQPSHRLPELPAFLPVLLLQALPFLLQLCVLSLQAASVKRQPPVVTPQLRQLLGETFAGVTQRLDLTLECQKLSTEDATGSWTLCLARSCHRFVCILHRAGVLQDEVKEVG